MRATEHVALMAAYNEWMNSRLYEAAAKLSPAELAADRKAFFGSILGTLNHLVVGDTIWLKRFAEHPARHAALEPVRALERPKALAQVLFTDFGALWAHRRMLDGVIVRWAAELSDADLGHVLRYASTKGVVSHKRFFDLLMHFFNHQTHHRGQATTLLSQAGVDLGVTDLLMLIPDRSPGG